MALTFVVTHSVTFGSTGGTDYQWELDILRSYEGVTAPSWASDPVVSLVASGNPIDIEWMSDRDTYKPIIGSKASIDLRKITGTSLPDFTTAGQFEYQVRLRYRRPGESSLNDYWTGFVQAIDGQEQIGTASPVVSFTATDGLAALEDSTIDVSLDSTTPINLFSKVLESLYQTGLNLDVLVDSKIRTAIDSTEVDALLSVTSHPYALLKGSDPNPLLRNKMTRKELIEGLLSAFNCRIVQSYGKWYVFNASTHGGDGLQTDEGINWSKYVVNNSEYQDAGYEQEYLNYKVGGDFADLLVANSDLQLNTRRPFGSVECRPDNVSEVNYFKDGLLQEGDGPWAENTSSHDVLNRATLINNATHPLTNRAFLTLRNRFDIGEADDIWFESELLDVNVNAPFEFSFDHLLSQVSNQDVYLTYAVELFTDNAVTVTDADSYQNEAPYSTTASVTRFVWDFKKGKWSPDGSIYDDGNKPSKMGGYNKAFTMSRGAGWTTESQKFTLGRYYDPGDSTNVELPGQIKVTFFYLRSKRPGRARWEGNDTNRVGAMLTNFQLNNKYSKNVTKPIFERVQADFTKTYSYKPLFADALPNGVYNRFEEEGFWRTSETNQDARDLEQIVTQQKLNDYRDSFKQYEGTLINISNDPIAPHHKLTMGWNNYTENSKLTIAGGQFSPKTGFFDVTAYVPNQDTDIAPGLGSITNGIATPGFHYQNIDLVAEPFSGRSDKVDYALAIVPEAIDEFDVALVTNPLEVEDAYENGVFRLTGNPGDEERIKIRITCGDQHETAASNMSYFDGSNADGIWSTLELGEDTAEAISDIVFTDVGKDLEVSFLLTLPEQSEFEILRIRGEVDPLLASNRNFDITFDLDANVSGATIVNTDRDLRGIPGTTTQVACIITPDADKQLSASSFTATVGTGITLIGFEQMGTSVYAEFEVTFQEDDTTITVDIDGNDAVDIPSGVETSTVTLTLSESIGNVSLSRTNLTLTGIVGTTAIYDVTAYAADGFELTASNFSATESEPWLVMANAVGGGESVGIPLEITFPQSDATGSATISGSAQATGSDTVSITLNFTNNVSNSSLTDSSETFILNPGQQINYTNTLTPSRGRFMNAGDLTITESSGVVAFSASDAGGGSINMSTSVTAPSSNVTIPVTLSGSVSEEPYVATVNLTEDLPQGMVKQNTLSQRFGATDSNVVFSVTVTPTEGRTEYASGTTFTIVNGTGSNYTYANGEVTFDLTVPLPTFSSSFPIGNVSIGSSITGIAPSYNGNYGLVPTSNLVKWSQGGNTTTASVTFGVVSTPVPGRWAVQSTSSGVTSATISSDRSTLTVVRPRTAGTYNGLPFFSTPTSTVTLVHQDDSSVTATITIVHKIPTLANDANNVYSNGLESIDVNIGGSAGSTAGVLYIT